MLNIILISLLIHYIMLLIKKPNLNILNCGIFGYVGIERQLDKKSFLTLGCVNDSRGGDSTGIFIDRQFEYGVGTKKYFSDFFPDSELLKNTTTAKIALGHCRKASVGAINADTAQPVVITNKDTGKPEFVLLHNGTLLNHKELAKKYLSNTPDTYTDSQIMAYIIYYNGFDVLSEYEGAGVFVIADYRKTPNSPDIYMFKGESLQYSYSKDISEERPIYISIEDRGIWFSSIQDFLETTRYGDGLIRTLKGNRLYHIRNGEIKSHTSYDRSTRHQSAIIQSYGTYHNPKEYADYDVYLPAQKVLTSQNNRGQTFVCSDYVNPSIRPATKLLFVDGKYVIDGKLAHGKYKLSAYGYVTTFESETNLDFWFFGGILLYNEKCYKTLVEVCELFGLEDAVDFTEGFPEIVYPYSPLVYWDPTDKKYLKYDSTKSFFFSGTMGIILDGDDCEYTFVDGKLITRTTYPYSADKLQISRFKKAAEKFKDIEVAVEVKEICDWLGYFTEK